MTLLMRQVYEDMPSVLTTPFEMQGKRVLVMLRVLDDADLTPPVSGLYSLTEAQASMIDVNNWEHLPSTFYAEIEKAHVVIQDGSSKGNVGEVEK